MSEEPPSKAADPITTIQNIIRSKSAIDTTATIHDPILTSLILTGDPQIQNAKFKLMLDRARGLDMQNAKDLLEIIDYAPDNNPLDDQTEWLHCIIKTCYLLGIYEGLIGPLLGQPPPARTQHTHIYMN